MAYTLSATLAACSFLVLVSGGAIPEVTKPSLSLDRPLEVVAAPQDVQGSCNRATECVSLPTNASCFGIQLPYELTSYNAFTNSELHHYWDVQARLDAWSALKFVPKCWAVIQPLLCSIYMPQCSNGTVPMLEKQLCTAVKSQCRIVDLVSKLPHLSLTWPQFIDCENKEVFYSGKRQACASKNKEDRRNIIRFNTTARCLEPYMVLAKTPESFYEPIDECGLSCKSPFFTDQEHESVSSFVFWGMLASFFASLFAVATFVVGGSWKQPTGGRPTSGRCGSLNNYSNRVIFYMNLCFLLVMIGVMAQFMSADAKTKITCRSDGTRRISEPGLGENFHCVVVFVLVYYFSIACCVWSAILVYTWSLIFRRLGKVKADEDNLKFEKRGAYFHILAWSLPLVLTIAILFMNGIDGDHLTGVCFISHSFQSQSKDPTLIAWFLLAPLGVTLGVNLVFTSSIFYSWFRVNQTTNQVISEEASARIKATLVKIVALFVAPISLLIFSTIVHHIYVFSNDWDQSLRRFLVCEAKRATSQFSTSPISSFTNTCEFRSKPSLLRIQLQLLCLFASALLVSALVWTKATCRTWKSFILKILLRYCSLTSSNEKGRNEEEFSGKRHDIKIKKHELIAQAYTKRNQLREQGRLSLTFHSQPEDPVGINLDSRQGKGCDVESEGFSSTWAAALPRLVQRRNGLVGAIDLGLKRSNSVDSDLNLSRSVSIRSKRFSYDSSRRHSFADSQFSVNQSELDHLQSLYKSSVRKSFFKPRRGKLFGRRSNKISGNESSCSATSQGSVASSVKVLPAITLDPSKLQTSETAEQQMLKLKTKLSENVFHVPPPGKSVDFSQTKLKSKFDSTEFIELQEKLQKLTNASKTSHETFVSEDRPNELCKSVQTSLTDLRASGTKDASTQDDLPKVGANFYPSASTTSSSQTESHYFLKKDHPVDANVIKIRVPSSEESSSIPSSYEARAEDKFVGFAAVPPPLTKDSARNVQTPHHKRGRRGGLVETDENQPRSLKSAAVVRTLDELELKSRTPEKFSQLQNLPDTIVAISTPSS